MTVYIFCLVTVKFTKRRTTIAEDGNIENASPLMEKMFRKFSMHYVDLPVSQKKFFLNFGFSTICYSAH